MKTVEKQQIRPRINVLSNYNSQGPIKLSSETVNASPNRTLKHCSYSSKSLTWPNDSSKNAIRQSIKNNTDENSISNSNGVPGLGDHLRRTASLDTFPQPQVHIRCHFMVDRTTQTPDEWNDPASPNSLHKENEAVSSTCSTPEPDLLQLAPNNVDGLSQEIERVLLTGFRPVKSRRSLDTVPDGHRAPIAGLFTEIWTPIPRFDNGFHENKNDFEEEGDSPNRISRHPPDGCDKVDASEETGLIPESFGATCTILTPTKLVKFEPSKSSAFIPLMRSSAQ